MSDKHTPDYCLKLGSGYSFDTGFIDECELCVDELHRIKTCLDAMQGIENPSEFMKLVRSFISDMDESDCTCGAESDSGSDYSHLTSGCYYHELKEFLLPKEAVEDGK